MRKFWTVIGTPGCRRDYVLIFTSSNFYHGGDCRRDWRPVHQWDFYAVGIGLGTDDDFMDRLARAARKVDASGLGHASQVTQHFMSRC